MCDGGGLSPLSPLCGAGRAVQSVRPLSVCSYFVLYRTFLLSARARKTDADGRRRRSSSDCPHCQASERASKQSSA